MNDDWQPIETAPKDAEILLYWPNYSYEGSVEDGPTIDIGWWTTNSRLIVPPGAELDVHDKAWFADNEISASYFTNTHEQDCYGVAMKRYWPTHWMKLPDPPKD